MLGFRAFFNYKYKFRMNISSRIYFLLLGERKYQIYMLKNEKQLKKIQKIQKYEENYQC
jgi:hypothetical protein